MSWKTTLCGVLALLGAITLQFFPEYGRWGSALTALASGLGLIFARDNNKTSEQVGAGQASSSRLSLFLLLAIAGLLITPACKNPQAVAYKAVGATAVTADQAMSAWGDYVAQFHPPASQEQAVERAYERYQAAMLEVTDAGQEWALLSSTNAPALGPPDRLNQALAGSSQALSDLVNLVRAFGAKP